MELVGVDEGTEDFAGGFPILSQQRRAGEADEDPALQPAFHLLVHSSTLGAVALVHKDVETSLDQRRSPGEVQVELVDQRAHQPGLGSDQLALELLARGDPRRRGIRADHPGVAHHAFDLFVEFVAVGDDEHPPVRVVFQQPLRQHDHEDALAAALGVPDDAALQLPDPLLRGLEPFVLVLARHLLLAAVEKDAVADDVEQAGLVAQRSQRAVEQRTLGGVVAHFLPLREKLLWGAGGAIAQPLRVVPSEHELHRAEEAHVEDRLLVGDELAHAVGHFH